MYKQLIINVTGRETRVALLEDGTIVELFIERMDDADIAGNIYKGRVQRVLPGIQAAFVDIGLSQAAFIYVDDIITEDGIKVKSWRFDSGDNTQAQMDKLINSESETEVERKPYHIEDVLKEGQEIMVQVAKAPIGTKGPRVTTYISLPGRFLVMMPTSDHLGVSRRIEDEAEKNRLKELLKQLVNNDSGYIIRTAAEGVQLEKLAYEMEFLQNLWNQIQHRYKLASSPSLIHKELTVSLRAVRDLFLHEADKLIIDSKEGYLTIMSFLDTFIPTLKNTVELYEGREPIFDAYNLEGDISRALKRKVWLKSGGYIVIEHTEALTAVDVNTGRYVGKHNLEETILKTNLEAVKEIAYQIRLRDIGGIIIIDFIDMEKKTNQEKVYNALKEALKKDRSKTHVLPMSDMGLIQMTRKRIKQSITSQLCEPCFYCDGEGILVSGQSVCYNIYRDVMRYRGDIHSSKTTLIVHPIIAELLHGEERLIVELLEKLTGKQIIVYPYPKHHLEQYEIQESALNS